jgi:hypothetical protein
MAGIRPPKAPATKAELARFAAAVQFPSYSFTGASATDILSAAGHTIANGNQVKLSGSSLPAPLVADRVYYARDVVPATSLKVSLTPSGAAVDLTGNGSGTIYRVG